MPSPRILAFAGSLRKDSFNKKLVNVAAAAAKDAGAEVTVLDLFDLALPLYNGDDEERSGHPDSVRRLKRMMRESHGFLIASPEYNSSVSAALKNAIDWASRPDPVDKSEPPLVAFAGKVAGIMAASPGALGGLRGLVTLRSILGNIQVIVLPDQVTLPNAHEAFDQSGGLKDTKKAEAVKGLGRKVADVARKLNG